MFDLPLGSGHSWTINEHEIPVQTAGEWVERITDASLPAWRAKSELNLTQSELFAAGPALEVMRQLVAPRPGDITEAKQVAVASFTRFGFQAAAITAFMVKGQRPPPAV